ncbi:MAG: FAD-dependent oxidoreductase [Eubacteriales bacterium]|jgi:NADPH-dependent 2,4-dienoyl-CoA reductase/sulfur reductase-like enzyme/rhodanese-related sulfurtransferase
MKVLIIGGVAGGATAAARLRRLDESAEIVILERTGYVSYANCGLPYYIGGTIQNKRALTLQTPQSFASRFRIDVRVHQEALSIDPAAKTVQVKNLETGEVYTESYDKLILSPGAKAVRPSMPGIDSSRIFTLRTVEDTFRIRETLDQLAPRKAVVIGGGFIGLEMAENLVHAGIQTTLLQRSGQVMPPLDSDMAALVHAYLRTQQVDLRLHQAVVGFEERDGQIYTLLKEGEPVAADVVILAIGVTPDSHLAKDAGLQLGAKDSIVTNEHMQTSQPDIYAVGDAVEVRHFVTGKPALIALAGPANKQGRIAADHICGLNRAFTGSQGSSVLKLFDMTIAATGISEKTARASDIACDKVVTFSASHATYYPGSTDMTIKTIFDPQTGKILGAQIVGFEGVDKRIDVLATAIHAGMTSADLEELDLAYAPPYSSAKDPVNMAGFVIENLRTGLVRQHHWDEVEQLPQDGSVILLDVRTTGEFARGSIPGAVNIPLDELRDRLAELDPSKKIYVNCQSALRSYLACRILTQHGFWCSNLCGGYRFYDYMMQNRCFDSDPAYPCGIKM